MMSIDRLELKNFRKFEGASIDLHPEFTLFVGGNGSGKTTVIDALAMGVNMWLGNLPPQGRRFGRQNIDANDIRKTAVKVGDRIQFEKQLPTEFHLTGQIGDSAAITWGQSLESEANLILDEDELRGHAAELYSDSRSDLPRTYPVFAFYGVTRAALPENQQPLTLNLNAGSRWDAYARWFNPRIDYDDLRRWFFSESAAAGENNGHRRPGYEVVRRVVLNCIPDADDIRFSVDERDIVCSIGRQSQPLRNLSDGQRMLLAMVADIAVKTVTLNAHLLPPDKLSSEDEPIPRVLRQTPGVVLIDELDVHLHPSWQRQVAADLKRNFPAIQFVCTSHSPQVIGEVPKEQVKVLDGDISYSPEHSFGVDSSRILEEIMDTPPRNEFVDDLLKKLNRQISDDDFDGARETIEQAEAQLGKNDPEVTSARTLMAFVEQKA